ncbi:MAG: site-specific DNA-methyltransferase [bacterium]
MSDLDKKLLKTPNLLEERLEKLKDLFPDLFTDEGKLNPEELKKLVETEETNETERYEFKWFGKSQSKKIAFTPTDTTLVFDEERSVNPEIADGNMIIEGENLETLKCLLAAYRNKIKMIYIDPPYNKDKDFVYSDKWKISKEEYWEAIGVTVDGIFADTNVEASGRKHSNWLSMMYPRLILARQLLKDDGVIFISIDDNEVHNLRLIMNEIFGEENFITEIAWRRSDNQANIGNIARVKEYLLCYCKNSYYFSLYKLPLSDKAKNEYRYEDKNGKFRRSILLHKTRGRHNFEVKTLSGKILTGPWMIKEEKFKEMRENDEIYWTTGGYEQPYGKIYLHKSSGQIPNDFWGIDFGTNQRASLEVEKLFNKRYFDYPKPVSLLQALLTIGCSKGGIILDFFAGSGTTAQAVLDLNKEDGGNRKFICVQLPELTNEKSEAFKAGYKKISDIAIERVKRVIENYEKEEDQKQPSLIENQEPYKAGFKVYKLAKSNFPRVEFTPDSSKTEKENLKLLDEYIQEKEALFFASYAQNKVMDEVLLKNGFMLDYKADKIDDITSNSILHVEDKYKKCLISLDTTIEKETIKALEPYKDTLFICLERALDTTTKWNLKHLFGDKLIAF